MLPASMNGTLVAKLPSTESRIGRGLTKQNRPQSKKENEMSKAPESIRAGLAGAPVVTAMDVIPVAGRDSMLLNLSGAHGPFFTRNLVILSDNSGHTGVGEVPGGEKIRETLEDARPLVVGNTIGACNNILASMREKFADRDAGGRGNQTFDRRRTALRRGVAPAWE